MDLAAQTTDALQTLRDELEIEERRVSRKRARIHERITFVKGGGVQDGASGAEQLELLSQQEQEISTARKELQLQIEAVRAELLRRRS